LPANTLLYSGGPGSGIGADWSPTNAHLIASSIQGITEDCVIGGVPTPQPKTRIVTGLVNADYTAIVAGTAAAITNKFQPCFELIEDLFPAFSPQGTQVAFARRIEYQLTATVSWELDVINTDGSSPLQLIPPINGSAILFPRWSSDGLKLYFTLADVSTSGNLLLFSSSLGVYVINASGTGLKQFLPRLPNSLIRVGSRPPLRILHLESLLFRTSQVGLGTAHWGRVLCRVTP
jgi:hypothetical protein